MWRRGLVTGASSGIGEAIARQLAAQGTELVVVARRTDRLHDLARSLDVPVEVLPADLSDPADRARVADVAGSGEVDVVVNNAGYGSGKLLVDRSPGAVAAQIDVLVTAVVELTHAALPTMVGQGWGGVLNISSVAANVPYAGSAVYNASKAFVSSFTASVHAEVEGTGVLISASEPGYVRTEFDRAAGLVPRRGRPWGWWTLDADRVAREALDALADGLAIHRPSRRYRALVGVAETLPRPLVRSWTRRAGLRRDER